MREVETHTMGQRHLLSLLPTLLTLSLTLFSLCRAHSPVQDLDKGTLEPQAGTTVSGSLAEGSLVHHRDTLGSLAEGVERRLLRGVTLGAQSPVHGKDTEGSLGEGADRRLLRGVTLGAGSLVIRKDTVGKKKKKGGQKRGGAVDPFVRRQGRQLALNGTAFYANGFNAYWLMYIASIPEQRPYVAKAFSQARAMGLTVCRTWAFYDGVGWHSLHKAPGQFDEAVFQSLDYVVATAGKMGIRLHMALTNNWPDYGGREQYVNWSRKAGSTVAQDDSAFFRDSRCRNYYKNYVKAVLLRKNTVTGKVYRDDPTIFGWDLINEPRVNSDPSGDVLQAWIVEMAAYVKSLDPNHLLSIGSEGFYGPSSPLRQKFNAESYMTTQGTDFIRNHQVPGIDLATIHVYASSRYSVSSWSDKLQYYQDYIQAHINDCNSVLKMPLLVEEFGPEGSSSPFGTIDKRDQVYNTTYSLMLASAKNQGAGAVSLFWHLLVDEIQSWDDGHAVIVSKQPSVVKLITKESQQLQGVV